MPVPWRVKTEVLGTALVSHAPWSRVPVKLPWSLKVPAPVAFVYGPVPPVITQVPIPVAFAVHAWKSKDIV